MESVLVSPDPGALKRYPYFFQPHLSGYIAAYSGKRVYNGHWSETLSYPAKNANTIKFFDQRTDDETRRTLLGENHIRYVVYVNALATTPLEGYHPVDWFAGEHPSFLTPVLVRPSVTLYKYLGVL